MARKKETNFSMRVAHDLDSLPDTWHEKIQQVALRGTPDRFVCIRGHFIALEEKASRADAEERAHKGYKLQKHKLKKIAQAGGTALVIYPENWLSVLEWLRITFLDGHQTEDARKH
jgi:hypothetical protein